MVEVEAIEQVLAERGPLTGADLHAAVGGELFGLWKMCRGSGKFATQVIGRRYVRLDRTVEGFARLSPSVLREFMTYCVVALAAEQDQLAQAAAKLQRRIAAISQQKLRVAERFTTELLGFAAERGVDQSQFCVLLAGDVVYEMAHDVPRNESSTGGRVDGSDLDLVVLVSDQAPTETVAILDQIISRRKWLYLRNSMVREEIDYVVKSMSKLAEQAQFDTFQNQVACKVFNEARYLAGNRELHEAGRQLLAERGVVDLLADLCAQATERRTAREEWLLSLPGDKPPPASQQHFLTDDEAAEFEHR